MRYFTLEEANRALVLVRPIVSDILTKRSRLVRVERQVRTLRSARGRTINPSQLQRAEHEFRSLIEALEYHVAEIGHIGCMLREVSRGLVDFPSWYRGHEIALCWEHGEDQVAYWHESAGGFASRKAVDDAFKAVFESPSPVS